MPDRTWAGIACALAGQGAALAVNDFHTDRGSSPTAFDASWDQMAAQLRDALAR